MAVAGCGSYSKIRGFVFLPITCFSLALTTFISQNLGAKQYARAKKGAEFSIICTLITAELIGICIYIFAPNLIAAFNAIPEVIAFGTGKSAVPMVVMMMCWCIIRISYISIAIKIIPNIQTIFWAYPLTWLLSSVTFFIYYRRSNWIHGLEKG